MADTPEKLLDSLASAHLHDLNGLVAVVTGGSSVRMNQLGAPVRGNNYSRLDRVLD